MSALYGTYARSPLAFERGEGVRLISQDGTRYLDFHAGIAVNALGYADPHLVKTMKEAAEKVWHTSNVFTIPEQERLGQRLVDAHLRRLRVLHQFGRRGARMRDQDGAALFLGQGRDRALRDHRLHRLVPRPHARHHRGRRQPALRRGLRPAARGLHPSWRRATSTRSKAAITPKTCAILIEPVQGEGGVTAMSAEFMRGLRALCDKHGMLLILDEVQCGYGRTGQVLRA